MSKFSGISFFVVVGALVVIYFMLPDTKEIKK